ncbi:leucine-rich repeat protein [Acetobacterium paludosum]|uniref:Leucine-rich repeat protein n=1 Tax=Acetobacterium paludosum TaxID=52693 RepID=A0A923HWT6_9FIRM|nr:leucine-rich repeat protein [Acetobacterium paludosum]MBC3888612.1 leucine-rich repeat protein [Acetobacterium paludosum]
MEIKKTFSKTMGKRILALLLTVVMVTGLLPPMTMPVQADGEVYGVLQSNGTIYETNAGNTDPTATVIADKTTVTHLFVATGVMEIKAEAFSNCFKLTAVDLSDVTTIGEKAFFYCTGLTDVDLSKVTSIGVKAFSYCAKLTMEKPMSAVTSVGENAFYGCSGLTIVNLPLATSIGQASFSNCTNLTKIELPGVTSIPQWAFEKCTKLTDIDLSKVTSVGLQAFSDCSNLKAVDLSAVISMGEGAFRECTRLDNVQMPKVTSVSNGAFFNCRGLTTVDLPAVTTIDVCAFKDCRILVNVSIPKATSISTGAFKDCRALANLTVGATPPTVGTDVFYDCPCTNLIIVGGNTPEAIAAYEAADTSTPNGYWYSWALSYPLTVTKGTASGDYRTGTTVTITADTPEAGYRFTTWTPEGKGNGVTFIDATDMTTTFIMPGKITGVTANYEAIPVTNISFDANSGAGDMTPQQISAGSPQSLTKNTFTRVGYSFKNWNTSADGSGTSYADRAQFTASDTESVVLYAQWTETTPAEPGYGVLRSDKKVYATNADNTKTDGLAIDIATVQATVTHLFAADDVKSIEDSAFCNCEVLTTVTMPTVTAIGKESFNGCQALTSVEVPAVTLIDEGAFSMDDALVHINMAAVETINTGAFANCEKMETAEMSAATTIGIAAFANCRVLTTVKMPLITSINDQLFINDKALTTVEIPKVTSIGAAAFAGCRALTTVAVPTVTAIGMEAFSQCLLLSNLTVGATPPTVDKDAFKACKPTNLTIIGGNTPGAIAAYEAADTSIPNGYWYGWALSYPLTVTKGTVSGDYRTGTTVTITAATPATGQRFTNWTVAGDGVTFTNAAAATTTFTMPGNAVAVTANYEAIPVTSVSYAANGGTGDMISQQISAGSPQNLSVNTFTRADYSFKNWNTSADGSGTSYADSAQFSASVAESIILYAQWTDNKNTFTVSGTVADSNSQPVSGAEVKLMQGNAQIGVSVTTDENGGFTINNVPNGNYNLVVSKGAIVVTTLVTINNANYSISSTIILPAGTMNSEVEVKADTPEIVVGNLEKQFTDADKKSAAKGDLVEIRFAAEAKDETAPNAGAITAAAAAAATGRTVGMFIDFSVLKTIGSSTPATVSELPDLIEVLIPLDPSLQGKTDYVIYRYHGMDVNMITTTANIDGEKIELIDDGKTIKLTAKKFSTYAVAYDETVPTPVPVKTYTLTYNENGGIGTMSEQVFTESMKQALVKNTFDRTGYTFVGWNTKQDGTGTAYADGADFTAAATSTLYAQWIKNEITVPDGVTYRTHIQNIGWENTWAADGTRAGTEGQSLRLEGIEINLTGDNLPAGAHIEYRTHIQNSGWENTWTSEGNIAGTVGQSLRLEAIQIRLVDMPGYSVQYRVHVQNDGWETKWSADGESAGTEGRSLRLEAIEIRLVKTND